MALLAFPSSTTIWKSKQIPVFSSPKRDIKRFGMFRVKAFINPFEEPIVKEALKEPIAFMSGMFAGLLRLDLNEDPLKEWLTRTVEASGITKESIETSGITNEVDSEGSNFDGDTPQQIEIE